MDYRNQIIDYIERCYQSYLGRQSDVLFNSATDELFHSILDVPICKDIISHVKRTHPIEVNLLKQNQETEYFEYFTSITKSREYYISYCLHWYEYIQPEIERNPMQGYDEECHWLHSNIRGTNDTMLLFKTDFVRPILNYIINQLNEEVYLLYVLEGFKQRAERFRTIKISSKTHVLLFKKSLLSGNSRQQRIQRVT